MRYLAAAMMLALAGCATRSTMPEAAVDPRGRWTVVAVDGEATGGGERFYFSIDPPRGSARFGCNAGSGTVRIERGQLITDKWITTVAGCLPPERMRFERRGFDISSQPMAIEARRTGGIRLRNRIGSIDLIRAPAIALNIVGEWTALAINGVSLDARDQFRLSITATQFEARACNTLGGGYRLDGPRLVWTGPWRSTERGCFDPTGQRDVMATEERAFAILSTSLTVSTPTPDTLRVQGPRGSIDLERAR